MKKKPLRILAIIFLLSLAFNLYLSFSSSYLNNDESYFNLRVINNIRSTGLPIFYDELSYGGRALIVQPLFYYLFTLFSFIPFYFKIFPALLISSLTLISYLIAREITNDENSSLFTALLAGFIPIYSKVLINQFSVYNLVLPLIALIIFCFVKMEEKKYMVYFIIGSFLLALMHSSSFLLLFILLFYLLLMNTENLEITKLKKEILIFTFFLVLFINVLIFKRAFLAYGFNIIHGNNPIHYTFNVLQGLYMIGIIPLFLGIIGLYQGFFKQKKESIILISSMILGVLFLLILNLININIGLLFLAFGLTITSSLAIKNFFIYFERTKFSSFRKLVPYGFILLFVLLSLIPTYFNYNKEFNDLSDFQWMRENSDEGDIILTPLDYGHVVTYFSRKNVIDSNFLLAPDPEQRAYDVDLVYDGWSFNKAVELLHEYGIKYIYISKEVKKIYNIEDLKYVKDEKCLAKVKESIYKVVC